MMHLVSVSLCFRLESQTYIRVAEREPGCNAGKSLFPQSLFEQADSLFQLSDSPLHRGKP